MGDYAAWVRRQPLLARLGTPVWTTVQTQPNEGLCRQLAALEPGKTPPGSVSGEQMRLLVYTAISAGSRGLLFLSRSPLSATDPDTRRRAMDLELLNLELQLIEPWAAGGAFVATVEGKLPKPNQGVLAATHGALAAATEGNLPEVAGAVLRIDRAGWRSPFGPARRPVRRRSNRPPGNCSSPRRARRNRRSPMKSASAA